MTDYTEEELSRFPRNKRNLAPREPMEQPGYYPGFSTLAQKHSWDRATRDVVLKRVEAVPERGFFSIDEWRFWEVVFSHIIPQTDRIAERQISITAPLDARLAANQSIGYRFEDMPQDREVYKLGQKAIDSQALFMYGSPFLELGHWQQEKVLYEIHEGRTEGAKEIWKRMSIQRFWQMLTSDATEAYYGHPWAWDEIGFGGPAYPRAYTRLERGEPEPWEVEEKRYEWLPPDASVSDEVHALHELSTEAEQSRFLFPKRKR